MLDLPDFVPLKVTQAAKPPSESQFATLDHLAILIPKSLSASALDALPNGKQLKKLLTRARGQGLGRVSTRLSNGRATGVTLSTLESARGMSTFALLTAARETLADCLRDRPAKLGVMIAGFDDDVAAEVLDAFIAATHAAAFKLPTYKTEEQPRAIDLASLAVLAAAPKLPLDRLAAEALGNNAARWFTAQPPNRLTASTYRDTVEDLARRRSLTCKFLGERELEKLGAGAFLAVAQGNPQRDAGLLRIGYRPAGVHHPDLTLVGKGVLFDTGGTNLKPFKGMLDMHTDMQGSAVALGTLLALAEMRVPYGVDAWLAVTENRISATGYKSQDIVIAANGTSIQVIHTDAEGRMVLADTLALAARDEPKLMIDYATLTGTCVYALTQRYSGVFTNRPRAHPVLTETGVASGERVWPFPMDEDFDQVLRSDIADVKQCAIENEGDHVVAARFLSRFVPPSIAWVHMDLSAGEHKGGLAHVPTDITGFGVRYTLSLLAERTPAAFAQAVTP